MEVGDVKASELSGKLISLRSDSAFESASFDNVQNVQLEAENLSDDFIFGELLLSALANLTNKTSEKSLNVRESLIVS